MKYIHYRPSIIIKICRTENIFRKINTLEIVIAQGPTTFTPPFQKFFWGRRGCLWNNLICKGESEAWFLKNTKTKYILPSPHSSSLLFSSSESCRGGSPSDSRFLARGSWGSGSLGGTLGNCRGGEGSLGGGDGSLGGGDGSLRGGEGGLAGVEKTGPEGSGSA